LTDLWEALVKAFQLIVSLDPEVMQISLRSLVISAISCSISTLICLPLAGLIHFQQFRGKRLLISSIQTLFSLPTVAVGLIVFVLFSRAGPLGESGLLFTPTIIIIGQVVLISPVILGLIISALKGVDQSIFETAVSLGADRFQVFTVSVREARYAIFTAILMGFGRAISEVGLSLIVGGNIKGFTRTITTAISLETSKGEIEMALALGIVLIFISLLVNIGLNQFQHR
jgi:tungstate transport system permease protein